MERNNEHGIFSGSAIIDTDLGIQKVDEKLRTFWGDDLPTSMARVMYPDDLHRLENAVKEMKQGILNVVTFRMANGRGEYGWYVGFLNDKGAKIAGKGIIELGLEDLTSFMNEINVLKDNTETIEEYFNLMEYLMMSYDVSTDKLKIFVMGNQEIDFYNGSLEQWKRQNLDNEEIDAGYISKFEDMCKAFATGNSAFEYELKCKLGRLMSPVSNSPDKMEWCMVKGKTIVDGQNKQHVIATLSVINPVTKQMVGTSGAINQYDPGTGLFNKRAIYDLTVGLMHNRSIKSLTFAIIDLDNFKYVNDTFGHHFGDEVLKKTADIIKEAVGENGLCGRIGGDEMFIVLENMKDRNQIRSILRDIRSNVEWSYKGIKDDLEISCSIGAATYPIDGKNYDDVFNLADKMLYLAKEKGRNRYIMYIPELHSKYVAGTGEAISNRYDLIRENQTLLVNELMENILINRNMTINEIGEMIGHNFSLEDISIFTGENFERKAIFGILQDAHINTKVFEVDRFNDIFNANNVFVIDNVNTIRGKAPMLYVEMIKAKICASVIYCLGGVKKPFGYIFYNKSKFAKKWTSSEIAYLTIIAKIIELKYVQESERDNDRK